MELPAIIRAGIEDLLYKRDLSSIRSKAHTLSKRYRMEVQDGSWHIEDHETALAYIASRAPATYAAIMSAIDAVHVHMPDLAPQTVLDIGSGPGTAIWAAAESWPSLSAAKAFEACPPILHIGRMLTASLSFPVTWQQKNVALSAESIEEEADIVFISYVLNELETRQRRNLILELWQKTRSLLFIIEPGSTKGWQRILEARQDLLEQGAFLVAPCTHDKACPLEPPDWCHFSRRIARTRFHKFMKAAELPFEDEKFIYLAVSRKEPVHHEGARILSYPHQGKGRIQLKLCDADGCSHNCIVSKRDGRFYNKVRRLSWGDWIERP